VLGTCKGARQGNADLAAGCAGRPALDGASAANHRGDWHDGKRLRRGPHARQSKKPRPLVGRCGEREPINVWPYDI
jgi:hypothetical protein